MKGWTSKARRNFLLKVLVLKSKYMTVGTLHRKNTDWDSLTHRASSSVNKWFQASCLYIKLTHTHTHTLYCTRVQKRYNPVHFENQSVLCVSLWKNTPHISARARSNSWQLLSINHTTSQLSNRKQGDSDDPTHLVDEVTLESWWQGDGYPVL